jgi:branched-chain amino acid transport system substrate-binding protein
MHRFLLGLSVLALGAASALAQDMPTFKIGVMNDQSGVYSDVTGLGSVEAAKMAVEDFKPEQQGFKVQIVGADHQNKPDIGSSIARKWLDTEGVDVIADVPTSSVALALAQIIKEKDKVFLNSGGGTSDLTGKACTPNTVHWTYDTWALSNGTARSVIANGGKSWFFITADYAFGHALERDASELVKSQGGTVLGHVLAPFPTMDFSSFLVQAQGSKADVVALANAGNDTITAVKQAQEFGLTQGGQKLAGLLVFISDIHGMGLPVAKGLLLTEAFYWDLNDKTREWSKRLAARNGGKYPTMVHAGVYAATLHYMKAIAAMDKKQAKASGAAVVAKMKETPSEDALFGKGQVRADGRHIHDMYLFQVKEPGESKGPYDYYKVVSTIPADKAFRPLNAGGCPLVK